MARLADFTTGTYNGITPTCSRASTGYAETVSGALTSFAADTLRRTDRGLLVEDSATNLTLQSGTHTNATTWLTFVSGTGTITRAAANTTVPDGTSGGTAVTVNRSSTADWSVLYLDNMNLAATGHVASHYVKAVRDPADIGRAIAISAAPTSTTTSVNPTLTAAWVRENITTTGSSTTDFHIGYNSGPTATTQTGEVQFHIWGTQVETGSTPTSYIPTTTSSVARAADAVSFTIPSGVTQLIYTFDNDTTQNVAVTGGASYTIPTTLNRQYIKFIDDQDGPLSGDLFFRPTLTDSTGNWRTDTGGTDLHTAIDEAVSSDADFIRSGTSPSLDVCRVKMTVASGSPNTAEPVTVRYRYRKAGGQVIDLRVRLMQGVTEIASWTHTNISGSHVAAAQVLNTTQKTAITDWGNLFIEFRATVP